MNDEPSVPTFDPLQNTNVSSQSGIIPNFQPQQQNMMSSQSGMMPNFGGGGGMGGAYTPPQSHPLQQNPVIPTMPNSNMSPQVQPQVHTMPPPVIPIPVSQPQMNVVNTTVPTHAIATTVSPKMHKKSKKEKKKEKRKRKLNRNIFCCYSITLVYLGLIVFFSAILFLFSLILAASIDGSSSECDFSKVKSSMLAQCLLILLQCVIVLVYALSAVLYQGCCLFLYRKRLNNYVLFATSILGIIIVFVLDFIIFIYFMSTLNNAVYAKSCDDISVNPYWNSIITFMIFTYLIYVIRLCPVIIACYGLYILCKPFFRRTASSTVAGGYGRYPGMRLGGGVGTVKMRCLDDLGDCAEIGECLCCYAMWNSSGEPCDWNCDGQGDCDIDKDGDCDCGDITGLSCGDCCKDCNIFECYKDIKCNCDCGDITPDLNCDDCLCIPGNLCDFDFKDCNCFDDFKLCDGCGDLKCDLGDCKCDFGDLDCGKCDIGDCLGDCKCDIGDCDLGGCDIGDCDLGGCDLDLGGCDFGGCDLNCSIM